MRIALLGPLEVTDGAGRTVEVGGARLRTLLTLLALDVGRIVTAERLVDGVWGDDRPAGAANALQSLVSRLRRALPDAVLESFPAGYRLALDDEAVDVRRFERLVARGRAALDTDPAIAEAVLTEALDLWRGPALADVAEAEFAAGPVSRLTELRTSAVEDRVEARLLLDRVEVAELEALVSAHPLRERLRGQHMRALYAAGRQADALAVFEETRRLLVEDLGVDPSPELEAVRLAVLRQEAATPVRTNLRARLTSFIGREDEVRRVGRLLDDSRLVTLTGPGGGGKTRLAVESADRLADRMPDGIWLVELAPLKESAEVPHAVLSTLGMRDTVSLTTTRAPGSSAEPVDRLVTGLSGKRLLIVLDNCEHLIDSCAQLADQVLARCPEVRILATSREALGITGERLWPVPPLAFPANAAAPAEAAGYPAVQLFVERSAAVRPGFTLEEGNAGAVLAICRRLDGMPLAIELAAARLRAMTADQVAERLDDRFRLLTGGSRTALPRHQTLRAVVDWSWDLLDDHERVLLRRLSVFSGGATIDTIEDVCGDGELATLMALAEKSLVVADETGRYRLLETIRAYASERLAESGETQRVRRRHALHFLELAERAEPQLRDRDQTQWLNRLSADYDNLTSGLHWSIDVEDAAVTVRYVAALGWYWFLRGHRAEAEQFVREALAVPGDGAREARALAYAYWAVGSFGGQGATLEEIRARLDAALAHLDGLDMQKRHPLLRIVPIMLILIEGRCEEALTTLTGLRSASDAWTRGMAQIMYGHSLLNLGRVGDLEQVFGAALAEFRAVGERWGLSFTLGGLAEILSMRGEHDRAIAHLEEALGLSAELGGGVDSTYLRMRLAHELRARGDRDGAATQLAATLRAAERRGFAEDAVYAHYIVGDVARQDGDLTTARRHLEQALEAGTTIVGPPHFTAMVQHALGRLALEEGDESGARELLSGAFRLAMQAGDAPIMAAILVGFADFAARRGDHAEAALLLGAAVGIRGMPDRSLPEPPVIERAARQALGADGYAEMYARGHAMTRPAIRAHLGLDED